VFQEWEAVGIAQISAIPALPAGNAFGIRYPRLVGIAGSKDKWFVRSWGLDFTLAPPSARGPGASSFSFGWGLDGAEQTPALLLMQLRGSTPEWVQRVVAPLESVVVGFLRADEPGGEIRICATVPTWCASGDA
jgi:hypothetical protein